MTEAAPKPVLPAAPRLVKPRLRGVLHQWAFVVFAGLAVLLIALASGAKERAAAATFAGALVAMFGTSAVYHRVNWRSLAARMWLRRVDHAMIYVLIAGTYTPFALLALEGAWRWTILSVVWAGALAAIVVVFAWVDAPKWLSAALGIVLGWVGIVMVPELLDAIGPHGLVLLAVGGVLYTFGAIVYARRRPDPVPAVFGYHEVFHACVIAAAACQYAVVAMLVAS
jgi:hemolysin III